MGNLNKTLGQAINEAEQRYIVYSADSSARISHPYYDEEEDALFINFFHGDEYEERKVELGTYFKDADLSTTSIDDLEFKSLGMYDHFVEDCAMSLVGNKVVEEDIMENVYDTIDEMGIEHDE